MLPGNQTDPGRQVASGRERFPIAHLCDQGGGDDWTNPGDFLEPPAFFARAVPSMNALLDSSDLCRDDYVLASKNIEAKPRDRWQAIVILIRNDLKQLGRAVSAFAEITPSSAICPRIAFDSIVR